MYLSCPSRQDSVITGILCQEALNRLRSRFSYPVITFLLLISLLLIADIHSIQLVSQRVSLIPDSVGHH